jgi:hypothetical protein
MLVENLGSNRPRYFSQKVVMYIIPLSFVLFLALSAPAPAAGLGFWCSEFGLFCPAPIGFVPGYVTPTPTISDGFGHTTTANSFYFATQTAATGLCQLLFSPSAVDACIGTSTQPCDIVAAPGSCSAPMIFLMFQDGLKENAGLLAANYTRNPESTYPGVALKLINTQLAVDLKAQGIVPGIGPMSSR